MTRTYNTKKFNLAATIRKRLEKRPMIEFKDLIHNIESDNPKLTINQHSAQMAYYKERKKIHTRTSQRTTGFSQPAMNVEVLQKAVDFMRDIGDTSTAVDAVQMLAKLMK